MFDAVAGPEFPCIPLVYYFRIFDFDRNIIIEILFFEYLCQIGVVKSD